MADKLQLKGVDALNDAEREVVENIANSNYDKIQRKLKNDVMILLKIKKYENPGKPDKAHKFSIDIQLKTATNKLDASCADWDLNRVMHGCFKKINEEIEHRFHASDQGRKG